MLRRFFLVEIGIFFDFLNLNLLLLILFDKDVNPDFVAETIVVTGDHAEIGGVTTRLLGSKAGKSPGVFILRFDNDVDRSRLDLEVVTVGLDEESVLRPGSLSIVADSPLLGEALAAFDDVFVAKAFFDKSSGVLDELGLFLLLFLPANFLFGRFLLRNRLLFHLLGSRLGRSNGAMVELGEE